MYHAGRAEVSFMIIQIKSGGECFRLVEKLRVQEITSDSNPS